MFQTRFSLINILSDMSVNMQILFQQLWLITTRNDSVIPQLCFAVRKAEVACTFCGCRIATALGKAASSTTSCDLYVHCFPLRILATIETAAVAVVSSSSDRSSFSIFVNSWLTRYVSAEGLTGRQADRLAISTAYFRFVAAFRFACERRWNKTETKQCCSSFC